MKTAFFVTASVLLALPASGIAADVVEKGHTYANCIESFVRQFAIPDEELQLGQEQPAPQASPAAALTHEDCVDFLIDQLAEYDERSQVQRGKPQPPPPPPEAPPARHWHAFSGNGSAAADASRLYLFGGHGVDWAVVPGDLWYFRVDDALASHGQWVLARTGTSKPGGKAHVGFSCSVGQCVVANGYNGVGAVKETWTYTAATSTWSQVNCKRNLCPSARGMPAMAYDVARGYHLLFGGKYGNSSLDDTYTFAGGRWTARQAATRPASRDRAAAAFVPGPVSRVVLFGGQANSTDVFCDMHAWTGSDWREVAMSNDGPCLHSHSMVWEGNRLVVTGGYVDTSDTPSEDVWYFTFSDADSGSWSQDNSAFAACAAGARRGARMAYDAPSGMNVFFGGHEADANGTASDWTVFCR